MKVLLVRYFETMVYKKNLEPVLRMQNLLAPNWSIWQQIIMEYFVNNCKRHMYRILTNIKCVLLLFIFIVLLFF